MKVLPFKIPKPQKEALVFQEDRGKLYSQLHQHEEIQISYIYNGSGSIILGDTISNYKKGDIIIIGENIPHAFRSDHSNLDESLMLTLFFTQSSFGKNFFKIADLHNLGQIFQDASYGIKIISHRKEITEIFEELKVKNKIERIASLLIILNLIIQAEKQSLSSFVYTKKYTDDDGKRMRAVIEYAMDHFYEPISLEEIAEKASMSKNAFCRYFKKRTNKTFFQFLIEIRIENACKLLYNNKELPISIIAERCGFHNIANFNRKFKDLKGLTPTEYKYQF